MFSKKANFIRKKNSLELRAEWFSLANFPYVAKKKTIFEKTWKINFIFHHTTNSSVLRNHEFSFWKSTEVWNKQFILMNLLGHDGKFWHPVWGNGIWFWTRGTNPSACYPSSLLHGNRGDSESGGFGPRDLNRRFRPVRGAKKNLN